VPIRQCLLKPRHHRLQASHDLRQVCCLASRTRNGRLRSLGSARPTTLSDQITRVVDPLSDDTRPLPPQTQGRNTRRGLTEHRSMMNGVLTCRNYPTAGSMKSLTRLPDGHAVGPSLLERWIIGFVLDVERIRPTVQHGQLDGSQSG
jgi:hypothetical protein